MNSETSRVISMGAHTADIKTEESHIPEGHEYGRGHEVVRKSIHEQVTGHFMRETGRDDRPPDGQLRTIRKISRVTRTDHLPELKFLIPVVKLSRIHRYRLGSPVLRYEILWSFRVVQSLRSYRDVHRQRRHNSMRHRLRR